jgi:hypothetical protein
MYEGGWEVRCPHAPTTLSMGGWVGGWGVGGSLCLDGVPVSMCVLQARPHLVALQWRVLRDIVLEPLCNVQVQLLLLQQVSLYRLCRENAQHRERCLPASVIRKGTRDLVIV